jgi:hypothetical protein
MISSNIASFIETPIVKNFLIIKKYLKSNRLQKSSILESSDSQTTE